MCQRSLLSWTPDNRRSVTSLPNVAPHTLPVKRRKVPGNDVAWRSFDRILARPWPKGEGNEKCPDNSDRRHSSITACTVDDGFLVVTFL